MRENFDHIEDYLAGKLEGEAREQFERAVQNDPELAAELALYRDMADHLAPSEEDALRVNLDRLGRQFAPAGRNNRPWWIAGFSLLLVLLVVTVWQFRKPAPAGSPPSQAPTQQPPAQQSQPGAPPVAQQTPPETAPAPNPDSLRREPQKKDAEPGRLAAAFEPNPRLEALLGNQMRGDDYRFRVVLPAADTVLRRRQGKVDFVLSGTLETGDGQVGAPFRVLLFTNNPRDYENLRSKPAAPLAFEKSQDTFRFRFSRPLKVPPGLYYYLIEAQDSGQFFYVGKFRVEH